jgi:hypothetical protein
MTALPQVWSVYHLFCNHTNPPKFKFVMIAFIADTPMGFLINSKLNEYVTQRPYLYACHVPIGNIEHQFLDHDSYIDCQNTFPFALTELVDYRGVIHLNTRAIVLQAVIKCPVLPYKHKMAIAAANHNP